MGNLTPKPTIQHINKKFVSNDEKLKLFITEKEDDWHIKKR